MSQPAARLYRLSRDDFLKYPVLKARPEYGLRQPGDRYAREYCHGLPVLGVDPPAEPLYACKIKKYGRSAPSSGQDRNNFATVS